MSNQPARSELSCSTCLEESQRNAGGGGGRGWGGGDRNSIASLACRDSSPQRPARTHAHTYTRASTPLAIERVKRWR